MEFVLIYTRQDSSLWTEFSHRHQHDDLNRSHHFHNVFMLAQAGNVSKRTMISRGPRFEFLDCSQTMGVFFTLGIPKSSSFWSSKRHVYDVTSKQQFTSVSRLKQLCYVIQFIWSGGLKHGTAVLGYGSKQIRQTSPHRSEPLFRRDVISKRK